jgi:hypothetical protein
MLVTPIKATRPVDLPVSGSAILTSAPATGNGVNKPALYCTFVVQAAAAATVIIEGSMDNVNWGFLTGVAGTSTLTMGASGTLALLEVSPSAWQYVRARVTAATVPTRVWMGA